MKACTCWGMKVLEDFQMGYENLKGNLMGYEFFEEKIIFPSTPVPGINNDQSLTEFPQSSLLFFPIKINNSCSKNRSEEFL